jgi:hypothetical protein
MGTKANGLVVKIFGAVPDRELLQKSTAALAGL